MKILITLLLCLGALIFITSCQYQEKNIAPVLQKAESLLDVNPDSALVILDEITNPQKLNKESYYQYYLVQLQAKYKSDKDITADTLVFAIQNYYNEKNDNENSALATYYSGRVYEEQKKYEEAMQQFLVAEEYLEQSKNFNLKGLNQGAIAYIYYKQFLKDKAIPHYKSAKKFYKLAKNYKNEIITCYMLGNCLAIEEQIDSAFIYYNEGLALAGKYAINHLKATFFMNMGVAYRELEKFEEAETHFLKAVEFATDSITKAKLANNFAGNYIKDEKYDLAIKYLQQALEYLPQEHNNFTAATIYTKWTEIEESRGNYHEALEKHKLYTKHLANILDDNENVAVLDIEAKYNFQLIENKNKQLIIERQRILITTLALLFLIALFVFFLFRRLVQNKKRWLDTEKKVRQLKKLAQAFDEKEESYRSILVHHFDIIKKAALIEGYLKEDERKKGAPVLRKFNEVVYGQKELDWEVLYQKLNEMSNGFFQQFKNNFPQLNESEFRICYLLYVEFNNTEIAIILNYSTNTVQAKKSSIRKKLGIKSYGNIHDFMKNSTQS